MSCYSESSSIAQSCSYVKVPATDHALTRIALLTRLQIGNMHLFDSDLQLGLCAPSFAQ